MSAGRTPLDVVLAACSAMERPHEPVTATEIAEELGCTRRTAYNKLDELADRGDLHSKKIGARGRVWWRPADRDRDRQNDAIETASVTVEGSRSTATEPERQLSRLIDNVPGMVYRCQNEPEWPMEFVSDACRDLTGHDPGALERGDVLWGEDVIVEADREDVWGDIQTAVTDREPFSITYRIRTVDGELRWVRSHGRGIFGDDGDLISLEGIISDITERKRLEADLAESELRYRTLVENFPNGAVGLFDDDLRYTVAGGGALDDADTSTEEIVDRTIWERHPEEVAARFEPEFRAALDGASNSFEVEFYDRHWIAHTVPVSDNDGDIFAGMMMIQDITERKERERQLQRYREYTDAVLDAIDDVFYILDESGTLQRWNDTLCEVTGYRSDEVESMHALKFFDEAARDSIASAIWDGFETGTSQVEAEVLTKDGERIPFEFVASTLADPDGNRVLAGIGRDVTEQKEREHQLRETVEQLEASNERLDSFASMLAHELRNPVTIGQIYSDRLPPATDSEAVAYVSEAFDRIETMIDVMLVLTRGREAVGERTSVRLADAAREAWNQVDSPDASVDIGIDRAIQGDETYIRHLFRNLFENAVEHGGRDVTVTVGELPDGFYVADDGSGIPADDRDAAFEPGFTTAAEEGGTGLGLAFVRKLADVYDWECTATESAAGGARFEFRNVDRETA